MEVPNSPRNGGDQQNRCGQNIPPTPGRRI
jgi:hypothetical protein